MAILDYLLTEVERRLTVRDDAFRDANGDSLFVSLRSVVTENSRAIDAVREIERRRSETAE